LSPRSRRQARMGRTLLATLILLAAAPSLAPAAPACSTERVFEQLASGDLVPITQVGAVPPPVLETLFETLKGSGRERLAEPGARFQAGDVVEPGLPRRKLVLGGRSPDLVLLLYEVGGRALSTQLFVACLDGDEVLASYSYLKPPRAESLEQLIAGLRRGCMVSPAREWLEPGDPESCVSKPSSSRRSPGPASDRAWAVSGDEPS